MDVINLINIVLAVILIAVVAVRFFWGFKKGFFKSLIRAAGTVMAIVLTFSTFKIVFSLINPKIQDFLVEQLASTEGGESIAALDKSMQSAIALAEGLIGPLVFWTLFLTFDIVFAIVTLVVRIILKVIPLKPIFSSRALGAAVSVVTGIVVLMMAYMPFAGYIQKVPPIYDAAVENGIAEDNQTVQTVMDELEDRGVFMSKFTATITSPVFKYSSRIKTSDGTKIDAFKEIDGFIKLIPEIQKLQSLDFSDLETVDFDAINNIARMAGDSDFLTVVLSEVMSEAGKAWLNEQEFFGINLKAEIEASSPGYGKMLDGVLQKLASCTEDNFTVVAGEFTSAIKSALKMVDYLNKMQNFSNGDSLQDLSENLSDILKELDSSTVEMILPAVSEEVFTSAGLSENEAQLVSDILTDTLTAVSQMDDEQIEAEAAAINTLVSYATNDVAEPDPDEVIDALVSSEIVLPAVKSVIEEKPDEAAEILGNVTEEQKAAITEALDEYKDKNPDVDEEKLDAIKALFGITD